jgi:hypothetical protein
MFFSYGGKGKKPMITIEKDYIVSGDWKCAKSPTGGHWWNCNLDPSVCKICGKVKLYQR